MAAKSIVRWYGKTFNSKIKQELQSKPNSRKHKNHLLVSFKGQKSGRQYTIPVNFKLTEHGTYLISTEGNWRHNFKNGLNVTLLVAEQEVNGYGVIVDPNSLEYAQYGKLLTGILWTIFSKSLTIIEIEPEKKVFQEEGGT